MKRGESGRLNAFGPNQVSSSEQSRYAKVLLFWLFVCVAVVVCPPKKDSPGGQESAVVCLAQNPIIRTLSQRGVQVYDHPKDSHAKETCKWEWHGHGTCCDAESLAEYVNGDIKRLQDAVKRVGENMRKLLAGLKKNGQKIGNVYRQAEIKKGKKAKPKDGENSQSPPVPLDNTAEAAAIQRDVTALSSMIERNVGDKKLSEESQAACFMRIKEIRTSSLCASCSGAAARFFLQGRALISMPDCRITLQKCGDVWAKSIQVMDAVTVAERVVQYLKKVADDKGLPKFSQHDTSTMQKFMGDDNIMFHLSYCRHYPHSCPDDSAKFLCETFISLEEKEFLEKTDDAIARSTSSWQQSGALEDSNQNGNNWRIQRLLMTAASNGSNTGSIMVSKNPPAGSETIPINP